MQLSRIWMCQSTSIDGDTAGLPIGFRLKASWGWMRLDQTSVRSSGTRSPQYDLTILLPASLQLGKIRIGPSAFRYHRVHALSMLLSSK